MWVRAQPERAGVALLRSLASWALAWERATARRESSWAPALGWGCSHSQVGMSGGHPSRWALGATGWSVRGPEAWRGGIW